MGASELRRFFTVDRLHAPEPQPPATAAAANILPGAPWLVAHRSQLGVEKPYKLALNNRDYVLWQTSDGDLRAIANVCPHMQAPLDRGWICGDRIACPFHALEFDGSGRLCREGKATGEPLLPSLDLIARGDAIWTYGGHEPRIPIPDVWERLTEGTIFVGVYGEKLINASFLDALKINYDFNHVRATHREPFKFHTVRVRNYRTDGYSARLTQEVERDRNTLSEYWRRPALLFTPQRYCSEFEYAFPAIATIASSLPTGRVVAAFVLYPETATTTRIFAIIHIHTPYPWLVPLLRSSVLDSFSLVVEQDMTMLEQLYPPAEPRIRLPMEEIMLAAEALYCNWSVGAA